MVVVLTGLMLCMLLGALDQTIMTPALPSVVGDLGGLEQMPAVITAYLVAATVVMPVYGKLGDRFGRKPLMQVAIVIFVVGAVLCATAASMPQFIAFRAVQGVGGGGLMIGAQAVIGEVVSPRERGRYLGLIGAAYVVAAVGGPLIGGFLIDSAGWRWIFAIYPPLGLLAFVVLTATLKLPRPESRAPVDIAGAVTLGLAVVGVVMLGQTRNPVFLALAALAVPAWLVTARYATDPILPLRLFRDRAFAVPVLISLLIGFALFGTLTYIPAYLQIAHGASATGAGLLVTALMAGVLTTTVVSGRLITRTGRYKRYPVAGTALAAAGLAVLPLASRRRGRAGRRAGADRARRRARHAGDGAGRAERRRVRRSGHGHLVGDVPAPDRRLRRRRPGRRAHHLALRRRHARVGAPLDTAARAAFAEAVPPVFAAMSPLLGVAFLLALALPARPLRTTAHAQETS
ncbi:MFS transporter [Nonomuraea ferruginea]